MTEWQLEKIIAVCRQSADIALKYYENPPMELKSDNSVVTAADKAVEAFLISSLVCNGDSGFIGEETIAQKTEAEIQHDLHAPACWIVDPIDGTAPYSCMFPAWGHSIALMHNGVITDGALYLPIQDELLITDGDIVWHYRNLRNPAAITKEKFVPVPAELDIRRPVAVAQRHAKHHYIDMPNQVFSWSACVAACHYLLAGKLMCYLAVVKLWDIAAMITIMGRTGYIGVNEFGKVLDNKVNEVNYKLAANADDRWRLRGATALAGNRKIADYVLKSVGLEQK